MQLLMYRIFVGSVMVVVVGMMMMMMMMMNWKLNLTLWWY